MSTVLTDVQVDFELLVIRVTNRRAALIGKRTTPERRDLMRQLIREHELVEVIAPMPGDEQLTYSNWWRRIYQARRKPATQPAVEEASA